jgi:hypothetical protein
VDLTLFLISALVVVAILVHFIHFGFQLSLDIWISFSLQRHKAIHAWKYEFTHRWIVTINDCDHVPSLTFAVAHGDWRRFPSLQMRALETDMLGPVNQSDSTMGRVMRA